MVGSDDWAFDCSFELLIREDVSTNRSGLMGRFDVDLKLHFVGLHAAQGGGSEAATAERVSCRV